MITAGLAQLFGRFHWTPPAWLERPRNWIKIHRRSLLRGTVFIAALASLSWAGYVVYQRLPKPAYWTATAQAVELTPYHGENLPLTPRPLRIGFAFQAATNTPPGVAPPASPAKLELIGQEIREGVALEPARAGSWRWTDPTTLEFQPGDDWPAQTSYRVTLGPKLLAKNTRLKSRVLEFETPRFSAYIAETQFGADESDPGERFVTARIGFSHPVDAATLESNLSLAWQQGSKGVESADTPIPFALEYDRHRRYAYLKSAPIALPEQDAYLRLKLTQNVRTALGGARLEQEVASGAAGGSWAGEQTAAATQLVIPSLANAFRLRRAETTVARDEHETPFQTLILQFTEAVSAKAVAEHLEVLVLPRRDHAGKPIADETGQAVEVLAAAEHAGEVRTAGNEDHDEGLDEEDRDEDETEYRHDYRASWSAGEIRPEVLALARSVAVRLSPSERETQLSHSLRYEARDGRDLYVRLRAGLESAGRLKLAKDFTVITRSADFPREARLVGSGAWLARGGDRKLSFVTRGVPALKLELGRVADDQLHHLISQTHGDISIPNFHHWNFNQDNLTERFEEILSLAASTESGERDARYASADLARHLGGRSLGLFFVKVQGYDPQTRSAVGSADERLVLVSNLGLLVKSSGADKTRELFAMNIAQGRPVAGAQVALLGKNGLPILERTTDDAGHARFDDASAFKREREPTVFVVRQGSDIAFIPYARGERGLNFSRFDTGGDYVEYGNQDGLSAFIFSDRGIYRPGETVHLGALVKRRDFAALPGLPLELRVSDPRGQTFHSQKLILEEYGFSTLDLATRASTQTGAYTAQVALIQGPREHQRLVLGEARFRVEEFQPDRLRIRAAIAGRQHRAWLKPGELKLDVHLENLFGAPAQNRKVTAQQRLSPTTLRFDAYSGYVFLDPLRDPKVPLRTETLDLPEARTNETGDAQFTLDLARYDAGIYRLALAAEGFEEAGGRGVTATAGVMISPLDQLVGWKADGDLRYLKPGSKPMVRFVAIGADEKPRALAGLTLRLMQRTRVSSLTRGRDGRYRYQSIEQLQPAGEARPAALPEQGLAFTLDTAQAGDFVLELSGAAPGVLARVDYFVSGSGRLAANLERSAELKLVLDKADYAAGEEIEMALTAPYAGSGLITIETNKVLAWKWFTADSNASVQRIRVPADVDGSAYVNVAFVRALDSPEIYASPLSYAVAPFSIARDRRTLRVTLEAPARIRPGETLEIGYRASAPARLALFAVDEGILQVARYETPRPLDHFLRKRALEVDTLQTLDLLLPEFRLLENLSAAGGGEGALELLGKNLNPFARKSDAPAAYWLGIARADTTPRIARYVVPDHFNGRLRLMAVAVNDQAIGAAESGVTVRAPIVITPNVLTVAAPGDEFEVVAGVNNGVAGSGDQARITLRLSGSSNLEILGEKTATLTLAENREGQARFRVKAGAGLGNATLSFEAALGEVTQKRSATLAIRPPAPYATSLLLGQARGNIALDLPRQLRPEFAQARIGASASPLILAGGLVEYLANYPYACTEQLISAAFPTLVVADAGTVSATPDGVVRAGERLDRMLNDLRARQQNDGGFSLWAGSGASDEESSLHALHFLREALDAGKLPAEAGALLAELLKGGEEFLRSRGQAAVSGLYDARRRAYAIYLLTRGGQTTGNYLLDLQEWLKAQTAYKEEVWRADALALWLAASHALLKNEGEAEKLLTSYALARKSVEEPGPYSSVLAQDAQFVYTVARHFPRRLKAITLDDLNRLLQPLLNRGYNTYSTAFTVMALHAYGESGAQPAGVRLRALDAQNRPTPLSLDNKSSAALPPASVSLRLESDNPLFYAVSQQGFDAKPPDRPLSENLEISREYLDESGKAVAEFVPGQNLRVRIRVRSTDGAQHANVALVDLFPGGFEADLDSAPRQTCGCVDSLDLREDRVIWFGRIGPDYAELSYTGRMTAAGEFSAPPAYAEAMYRQDVRASTAGGRLSVRAAE